MTVYKNGRVDTAVRFANLHVMDALVHMDRAILAQPSGEDRNKLTEINIKLMEVKNQLESMRAIK